MRRRRGGPGTALHWGRGLRGGRGRESGGARGALEAQVAIKKIMQELRSRTRHESDRQTEASSSLLLAGASLHSFRDQKVNPSTSMIQPRGGRVVWRVSLNLSRPKIDFG